MKGYNFKHSLNGYSPTKCNFAGTEAQYITRKYGIPYTKQAVQQRAEKFEEEIKRYKAEMYEIAHLTIFESVKQDKDIKLRYRAAIFMLEKLNRTNHSDDETPKTEKP